MSSFGFEIVHGADLQSISQDEAGSQYKCLKTTGSEYTSQDEAGSQYKCLKTTGSEYTSQDEAGSQSASQDEAGSQPAGQNNAGLQSIYGSQSAGQDNAGSQYKSNTTKRRVETSIANLAGLLLAEQNSFYRVMFNASFFRDVGFFTKRAADAMISLCSDLQGIFQRSVNRILRAVTTERHKIYTYMQTKYKPYIEEAALKDEEISKVLKYERALKDIERFKEMQRTKISTQHVPREAQAELPIAVPREAQAELPNVNIAKTDIQNCTNHFDAIMNICKSDPSNYISVKIMSYIQDNKLA